MARGRPLHPRRHPAAPAHAPHNRAGSIEIRIQALPRIPEVKPGDDLAALIAAAVREAGWRIEPGDVLVISQKIVSKAEGRVRDLHAVEPGPRALELAERLDKDPRLVQVIVDETREIVRAEGGVLICEHHSGNICANAGVDLSNSLGDDIAVLLPEDPDESARRLRAGLERELGVRPAVVIADSFGRPWRLGQVDVAIGCAGLVPLDDWRGRLDSRGRELTATVMAIADEAAAAAGLVHAKDGNLPVAIIRGLDDHIGDADGIGAAAVTRPKGQDLFRR